LQARTIPASQSKLSSLVTATRSTYHNRQREQNSSTQVFRVPPTRVAAASLTTFPLPASSQLKPYHTTRETRLGPHVTVHLPDKTLELVFFLTSEAETIGRAPDSSIYLKDATGVSRYHARILRQGDGFLLVDLNSSNGTFLNGARVLDPVPLSNNDVIAIGNAELHFAAE
jgi:pSer/pThr/pTyr-binding forkhead associated (FHA) protein